MLPDGDQSQKDDDRTSSSSDLDEAAAMSQAISEQQSIPVAVAPPVRNELVNPHWAENEALGRGPVVPLSDEENQFFQVRHRLRPAGLMRFTR
jgi:hypothetical protein